ncbi:MAG: hypothetical protein NC417_00760 [Candidatus Gastranaerophilales bacterium]|nr:hypothetical protein [Candidatus Gastranaerophilales bacterium]
MESRTINSTKNFIVGISGQIINIALSFFARTIFIYTLSKEYLGISGLFSNILSILSISELGIGTAIAYSLYKPLAQNDRKLISAIMSFYAKAYKAIGFLILVIGLMLVPFLPYLIKGSTDLVNIRYIYLLYLLESVTTYWFFAYKSTLLKADQKTYVVSVYEQGCSIVKTGVRIAFLLLLRNNPVLSFYLYTIIGLLFNVCSNILVAKEVDKRYAFLADYKKETIPEEEKDAIKKNVFALCFTKISAVIYESTDHLIISAFVGVAIEGVYSNYAYIVSIINGLIRIFASSIGASIGNLNATESTEKKEKFMETLHFMYFWVYGFCAICLWEMLNPFIVIWVGSAYELSPFTVLIIVINFLVYGLMSAVSQFQTEAGLYWQGKIIPILSSGSNIFLSILFSAYFKWGILGILGATIISRLVIVLPLTTKVVYHNIYNKKGWIYILLYFRSLCIIFCTGVAISALLAQIHGSGIGGLIIRLVICIVGVNGLWLCLYKNTDEFKSVMASCLSVLKRVKKKGKKNV